MNKTEILEQLEDIYSQLGKILGYEEDVSDADAEEED